MWARCEALTTGAPRRSEIPMQLSALRANLCSWGAAIAPVTLKLHGMEGWKGVSVVCMDQDQACARLLRLSCLIIMNTSSLQVPLAILHCIFAPGCCSSRPVHSFGLLSSTLVTRRYHVATAPPAGPSNCPYWIGLHRSPGPGTTLLLHAAVAIRGRCLLKVVWVALHWQAWRASWRRRCA